MYTITLTLISFLQGFLATSMSFSSFVCQFAPKSVVKVKNEIRVRVMVYTIVRGKKVKSL